MTLFFLKEFKNSNRISASFAKFSLHQKQSFLSSVDFLAFLFQVFHRGNFTVMKYSSIPVYHKERGGLNRGNLQDENYFAFKLSLMKLERR